MKATSRILAIPFLALSAIAAACADDDGGDGGDGGAACPDVSGTYLIQEHCEEALEGGTVEVAQDGCDLTSDWGSGDDWAGTVDADGYATAEGTNGSTTLACGGQVEDGVWTIDCEPYDCHVVLVRQ